MLRPLCASLLLALALAANAQSALTTVAERSGFSETGRYEEVTALCDAFARQYPKAVRCTTFGTTPEGRPMKALVASTSGALTSEQAQRRLLLLALPGLAAPPAPARLPVVPAWVVAHEAFPGSVFRPGSADGCY